MNQELREEEEGCVEEATSLLVPGNPGGERGRAGGEGGDGGSGEGVGGGVSWGRGTRTSQLVRNDTSPLGHITGAGCVIITASWSRQASESMQEESVRKGLGGEGS